ncbi:Threonylcarbamoyl adenosine biosynthesis protein TsaE [Gracilaria domingensis]|nr:Threonylcarbamoyl adenosine biosynthesis protein TsaE [Gracilaria domingensis]
MFAEHLAWNTCSRVNSAVTTNYYMMRIPHVKSAVTHSSTHRPCSYARLFSTRFSHSLFPRFTKEALGQRKSGYLPSTRICASKRERHHSDITTSAPAGQICASLSEDRLLLPTESHTYKLGRLLGQDCRVGDVILLFGDLGVGKTALARGYIHSAHFDQRVAVTSPTYLLLNSYATPKGHPGIPEILHMDLWRLNDASQRPIVDFKRAFDQTACLIEWPDRLKSITPVTRLEVHMSYVKEEPGTKPAEDDPWGFGTDDPRGSHEERGRQVLLKPHGKEWDERLLNIVEEFCRMDTSDVVALESD